MRYRKLQGYKYELLSQEQIKLLVPTDVVYKERYLELNNNLLTVKKRYAWDGPSGPTIDTPDFMLGSLFHDALYQLMREGILPPTYRIEADKLLRRVCLANGMSRFRAWYIYIGVRFGASGAILPRKHLRGKIIDLKDF